MTDSNLQIEIEAANAYEALFVPALFGQWASKVANAAAIRPGQRVLDIGCGTGVLAREIASRAGLSGHITGLDPNRGMLEVARKLTPGVNWKEGVAESLPFGDQSFDVVVSQFSIMFFADHRQALQEMIRVLVPGGRIAVAVWDSLDNIPAYAAEVALLERIAGKPAADALKAPFILGDKLELAGLFRDAGFAPVNIATHHGMARFRDVQAVVEADLRGWLPVMGVVLAEEKINRILQEAVPVLSPYLKNQTPAMFDLSSHIVTGTKK